MHKIINYNLNNSDLNQIKRIEQKIVEETPLTEEEANCFLSYIVAATRKIIVDNFGDGFENRCDLAQSIISSFLNQVGVKHYNVATQKSISDNVEGHSFNVAVLKLTSGETNFLIDPTYQQFFVRNEFDDEAKPIIINGMVCVSSGLKNFIPASATQVIENFIYWGFKKLDSNFAKIYGDSFLYTKTNIPENYSFPNIPGEIYINSFLKGKEKLSYGIEMLKNSGLYLDVTSGSDVTFVQ